MSRILPFEMRVVLEGQQLERQTLHSQTIRGHFRRVLFRLSYERTLRNHEGRVDGMAGHLAHSDKSLPVEVRTGCVPAGFAKHARQGVWYDV